MTDIKNKILNSRHVCSKFIINTVSNDVIDYIASKLNKGANFIQIRQGNITSKAFFEIALKLRQLTSMFGGILIIEDRLDIAKLVKSDGIFIDNDSIEYKFLSSLIDENMIIGSYPTDFDNSDYVLSDKTCKNKLTYITNDNKAHYRAIQEVL